MMCVAGRPVHKDRQGVVHFAYNRGDTFFEVLCEVYVLQTRPDTDEPVGTPVTCLACWYMVINQGAKAKGQR